MTTTTVDFIFNFNVSEEKQARYEEVIAQQISIAKDESDTLIYEIFKHADGTYCQHERYQDEVALMTHIQNTTVQLQEWMEIVDLKQVIALGPLSEGVIQQFNLEEHYVNYAQM